MTRLFLVLSLAASTATASPWFVSPEGNDARDGRTPATAFATLARARDAVRAAPRRAEGPREVRLLPGLYRLTGTVEFTSADSGAAAAPVVYRATEPGAARFVGGRDVPLSAFRRPTDPKLLDRLDPAARDHVVAVSLDQLGLRHADPFPPIFNDNGGLFEVFCDNRRLPLSRWPNEGYAVMKRAVVNGDESTPGTFEYHGEQPARWTRNPNVWLQGQWRVGWEQPAMRVGTIDPAQHTITFAQGLRLGIGAKWKRPHGSGEEPWCAINLVEEIDRPGEWAVDFDTRTLYLWPPDTRPDLTLFISQVTDPLLRATGASHLAFEGLVLEHSLGDGLVLEEVSDVRVAGCIARNLAGRGLVLHGVRSTIQSCDVYQVGRGALYVSGGDRLTLEPSRNQILNNHLHHYGVLKPQYSAGIHVGVMDNPAGTPVRDAVGIRVANNCLHHGPRDAFLHAGNDNIYELNEVYYCGYDTQDTGVFYSWLDWTIRNNVIRHNFMHDTVGGVNPDDGASGSTVHGNVFAGSRSGVWIASGPDHHIRHNIFVKEKGAVFGLDDRGVGRKYATNPRLLKRLEEVRPDQPPWSTRYPEMKDMLAHRPELPWRTVFRDNLIVSQSDVHYVNKLSPATAALPGILTVTNNWITTTDPGFVDLAAGNYELKPDAEVFQKIPGFPPIPFRDIGLKLDAFRTRLPTEAEAARGPEHSPFPPGKDHNFGT